MKKLISIIIVGLFLLSCAPAQLKPIEFEPIKFKKTPPFSIQEELNKIPKPEPMKRIYVKKVGDKSFEIVENKTDATHITLTPTEYAKVGALLKILKTYKGTIQDLEKIMNIKITTINDLKEMVEISERKAQKYAELYILYKNEYRQEKYEHDWDNRFHKAGLYAITIGAVVVMLLLL